MSGTPVTRYPGKEGFHWRRYGVHPQRGWTTGRLRNPNSFATSSAPKPRRKRLHWWTIPISIETRLSLLGPVTAPSVVRAGIASFLATDCSTPRSVGRCLLGPSRENQRRSGFPQACRAPQGRSGEGEVFARQMPRIALQPSRLPLVGRCTGLGNECAGGFGEHLRWAMRSLGGRHRTPTVGTAAVAPRGRCVLRRLPGPLSAPRGRFQRRSDQVIPLGLPRSVSRGPDSCCSRSTSARIACWTISGGRGYASTTRASAGSLPARPCEALP
jgi:hypothetical protein